MQDMLKLKNVSKFYYSKGIIASGITKVSLSLNLGEFVVITGESGSGKSTLLNVLSGLDSYEEGEMYINGEETSHYNESDFEDYRKTYIANIFQSFNLVGSYTVYQNIELVLLLNGYNKRGIHKKIIELIKKVDLYRYRNTRVSKLSGGQKQRVAIARALAKDTPIIIADEPTGNLDVQSATSVIKLLSEVAKDKLVIIVTHNYEQVEEYATRKIEMHDGKIREDITLKETKNYDPVIYDYKNISFFNKIRLGIRNAFNIVPKFLLTFLVFFFVVAAFLNTYAGFRKLDYEESKGGYNGYFANNDYDRIVIKKNDGSPITQEDYQKIRALSSVKKVVEKDIIIDDWFTINDGTYYFNGVLSSYDNIEKVDAGRLPQNENEVIISLSKDDYYKNMIDVIFASDYAVRSKYGNAEMYQDKLKIVGAIYTNDYEYTLYVSNAVINAAAVSSVQEASKLTVKIGDNEFTPEGWERLMNIRPSKIVSPGQAAVSTNINYLCTYEWCMNKKVNITVNNIYYTEEKELTITSLYNKYNYQNYTSLTTLDPYSFEGLDGIIYISEQDYNELYNKYDYQSSVFAKDDKKVDVLAKELNDLGFETLCMKDTLNIMYAQIQSVIRIFKIIVTVVLFVVLFFISYFVIRLIQKSKNIYYSTVRILGGSRRVIRNLISIELLTIFHIAYIFLILFLYLSKINIIKISFMHDAVAFLVLKDFIIIYLILFVMSYYISIRYSLKLFKSSAMKAYNEEV